MILAVLATWGVIVICLAAGFVSGYSYMRKRAHDRWNEWWASFDHDTDNEGQIIVYTGEYAVRTEHLRERGV